jgi:hypothetical protein
MIRISPIKILIKAAEVAAAAAFIAGTSSAACYIMHSPEASLLRLIVQILVSISA